MSSRAAITVAAAQLAARPIERSDDALEAALGAIRRAGQFGVDLLVLPECTYPAYNLRSRATYDAAPLLDHDALIQLLCDTTRDAGVHLVAGLVESRATRLHNAAVLINPAGRVVGVYRKQFLWDRDHDYFAPGESIDVFQTGIGRIGMLICADARAPEIVATLAAQRADLVAMPTNWVNAAKQPGAFYNPQPDFLIPARCREFGLPFICANKSGQEDDETRFCGMSRIVLPDGTTAAEAGPTGDAIVVAEIPEPDPFDPGQAPPAASREWGVAIRPGVASPAIPRQVTLAAARTANDLTRLPQSGPCIAMTLQPTISAPGSLARGGVSMVGPMDAPGLHSIGGVFVGYVAGDAANGFAWPRALALQGAQLLCLSEARSELDILRTRAVENRVFVAALTDDWLALIGPDATVLAQDPRLAAARVDLAEAAIKTVAPQTDVFAERRPACYRF